MQYEIDKVKFGVFISDLRKEKGMTQKELAEKLYVSDKAVSKWERGQSLPDITMLNPLADVLGVTSAELLNCGKIDEVEKIDTVRVNEFVEKTINFSERANVSRKKCIIIYFVCFLAAFAGIFAFYRINGTMHQGLITVELLTMIFGTYFMFFIKERLPKYFDENKIDYYTDGFLRLHTPGIYYNNHNWPYIIKYARISLMTIMVVFPIISLIISIAFDSDIAWFVNMAITVGMIIGIVTPIYFGAIKHK